MPLHSCHFGLEETAIYGTALCKFKEERLDGEIIAVRGDDW